MLRQKGTLTQCRSSSSESQSATPNSKKPAHTILLLLLFRFNAEPSIRDMEGYTALHRAVMSDNRQVALKMLEKHECLQVRRTIRTIARRCDAFLSNQSLTVLTCSFQGLLKAQQVCATAEMTQLVRLASARRQCEIVNPLLFECAMNGDAQRLFCTLEDGDCVNPMVSIHPVT